MARQRIESVDLLRGVIMIVMALDHTRDFFGIPGQNPIDLGTASPGLFLTRWITFFCAPVFFLLTGTGAALSLGRKSPAELSRFLVTRGVWLIFLELVVLRCFSYQFNFDFRVTLLLVIWALGWAMIALSVLSRLPVSVITILGVGLVAGHNLLDGVQWDSPIWAILHRPGFVLNGERVVFVAYPLIPWIG
ncbi:MAG: heparan-alpha-glucosaminide N-acetyltransferase domain-containing protein, partial [Gemmatimonadota bacterium]